MTWEYTYEKQDKSIWFRNGRLYFKTDDHRCIVYHIRRSLTFIKQDVLKQKGVCHGYNGSRKSDSDTKNVTGKENGIGSVDENGKQKECQTCKNRKYVDGSDEANVSFKSAAHVSPQAASSAVRAHEGQHVSNAYSKASEENGRVISASVQIHTSICPECGRSYVSGGVTNTQIKYYNESNPYQKDLKVTDGIKARGDHVDMQV